MSERLKRSVGAICICCNMHDRSSRAAPDPDWLEIVGHPTIPHVQSLRAPPAQVALSADTEPLVGLMNRNASRRYLQKLQKDRERNQEVLTACVDHLPIVIRQMVEPGHSAQNASRQKDGFRAKPVRSRRNRGDIWQPSGEQWVHSEHMGPPSSGVPGSHPSGASRSQVASHPGATAHRKQSTYTSDTTSERAALNQEFVHYAGFHGSNDNESNNLKYRFGKRKPKSAGEDNKPFHPKGFGAVYDTIEFERRYKKVFDTNQHVHFVHSNFLSGQRLFKRSKLPPIGHIPSSVHSEPPDTRDIFAIMSVQRFNHPVESGQSRAPASSPGSERRTVRTKANSSILKTKPSRHLEIAQEVQVPVGFVPGTIKPSGHSPFDGVTYEWAMGETLTQDNTHRFQLWSREGDSALGTLTEDASQPDEHALTGNKLWPSAKSRLIHPGHPAGDSKSQRSTKRREERNYSPATVSVDQDPEPFNISVHVNIKPKDPDASGGDDIENERARDQRQPVFQFPSSTYDENQELENSPSEKVVYPTKFLDQISEEDGETVISPRKIQTLVNQYGFVSQKVQYPDRFVINDSLVEDSEEENDGVFPCPPKMEATFGEPEDSLGDRIVENENEHVRNESPRSQEDSSQAENAHEDGDTPVTMKKTILMHAI
ncbi:uncharacterized protein LOC128216563 isoform X2 [Mya arenaria]|uniref:uncharacterized protein LOC128216563 isoform X2 n=1 Tax=Mya arenaria TaxID=6604 RepID=UPI0022E495F3|nr:uncharacterized protein LOC128216563 isoform X2 [Mya arenaria]